MGDRLPRLFIPPFRLAQAEPIALTGEESRYLTRVLRLRIGEPLRIFNGQAEWLARLSGEAQIQLDTLLHQSTQEGPRQILLQPLAKGERFDWMMQKATELGMHELWPLLTERCVVRPDEGSAQRKLARWKKIAETAARQCERPDIPTILPISPLTQALSQITQTASPTDLKLLFWEARTAPPLAQVLP